MHFAHIVCTLVINMQYERFLLIRCTADCRQTHSDKLVHINHNLCTFTIAFTALLCVDFNYKFGLMFMFTFFRGRFANYNLVFD